jgi:hypothetical protein
VAPGLRRRHVIFGGTCPRTLKVPRDSTFLHFGSLCAAARRIESKFCGPPYRGYCGNSRFILLDSFGRKVGEETIEEALEAFADYASSHTIGIFDINVANPLPLNDLWGDDPIASGGIGIVASEQITEAQRNEKKFCDKNSLARLQLNARKRRSNALGDDWRIVGSYECVWVQLTVEFRRWATQGGYDGFTYLNEAEGLGEQSIVCLHANQAKPIGRLAFDKDLYLTRTKPIFEEFIHGLAMPGSQQRKNQAGLNLDVFWAGMSPEDFWVMHQ